MDAGAVALGKRYEPDSASMLEPGARQLHDELKSGGIQPAHISMIHRR
jgi:hypothetical protein